jgi:hypothetical protein
MNGDTAPQQIEAQIAASRAELGAILDRIERKLIPTPRQLLHRGVDMLKDRGAGDAGSLRDGLRNHTGTLALVGLGLGWLLLSRGVDAPDRPYPTDGADYAHARIKPDAEPDPAEAATGGGGRGGFGAALVEHPLALGALAFLAGAAISLLLPRATVERAQRLAERAADTAINLVKNAVGNSHEA